MLSSLRARRMPESSFDALTVSIAMPENPTEGEAIEFTATITGPEVGESEVFDLLWDFVRAEFADGSNVPRIPPQRYGIGIHYRGDQLRGGVWMRFVDDQDRTAENETPTDSYTMVNADVSYRFFFDNYFLDLILRGTNLTDEEARMHTSFVKDDVPLPGRNLSLIARLGF